MVYIFENKKILLTLLDHIMHWTVFYSSVQQGAYRSCLFQFNFNNDFITEKIIQKLRFALDKNISAMFLILFISSKYFIPSYTSSFYYWAI